MNLWKLPNEVLLMVLSFLDFEGQFNLALTSRSLFHFISRSDEVCKITLKEKAPFAPEYLEAQTTGGYGQAWRRFVKRRIALRTATPYHFSIVGVGLRFVLYNDALIYQPTQNEIRMLFLHDDVELRIDTDRLAMSAFPDTCLAQSQVTVDPLYYSDGVASFLCELDDQPLLVFCHLWQKKPSVRNTPEHSNNIFVRNNELYLYYGYRKPLPGDQWAWEIAGFDLTVSDWCTKHQLPLNFAGIEMGQNVCFEIFDGYLYGISTAHVPFQLESARPVPGRDSYYYAFRILVGSNEPPQLLSKAASWRRDWQAGSVDTRFSDLKLVKDEETGSIVIYETLKEWTLKGYSERNCHRKEICSDEDWEIHPVVHDNPWWSNEEHMYNGSQGKEDCHVGDSGLSHTESDPRRLQAFSYNTTTRTFLDIVCVPTQNETRDRLFLRARAKVPYMDDSLPNSLWKGDADPDNDHVHFWPPAPKGSSDQTQNNHIRTMMNPKQGLVERVLWVSNQRFLIFSPISKGIPTQPSAIILLSFDPGFRFHGLRKIDGSCGRDVPLPLMQSPLHDDPGHTVWIKRVQPFHLLIKPSPGQYYGFDFTHQ